MNNDMLTQIDDDMLDQVSGGRNEFTIGGGTIIGAVVDGALGLFTAVGNGVKELASWLPSLTIGWGKP